MKNMVEIEVVLDERYVEPKVTIKTKSNSQQVENIINAIENASNTDFPQIPGILDDQLVYISQRDIVRIHTEGRRIVIQTDEEEYIVKKPLASLEQDLNPSRFLRISQSEIINLNKVKHFDFNISGTIGVEFEDGTKSWVSRKRIKQLREVLKENSK